MVIKAKMEKTFSYRWFEIVEQKPMIQEFKSRWPALFQENEASEFAFRSILRVLILLMFMNTSECYSSTKETYKKFDFYLIHSLQIRIQLLEMCFINELYLK